MNPPKAPCGADASIKHFQDCEAPECVARYKTWKELQGQTREMLRKFWTKKEKP
jgi:hypothetical protein